MGGYPDFSLTGRTALVTGSVRGLGLEMARGLGRQARGWPSTGATPLPSRRRQSRLPAVIAQGQTSAWAALSGNGRRNGCSRRCVLLLPLI